MQKENVPEREAAALHHFRIYLGKGGCHEAFAESVYRERRRQDVAPPRVLREWPAPRVQIADSG